MYMYKCKKYVPTMASDNKFQGEFFTDGIMRIL